MKRGRGSKRVMCPVHKFYEPRSSVSEQRKNCLWEKAFLKRSFQFYSMFLLFFYAFRSEVIVLVYFCTHTVRLLRLKHHHVSERMWSRLMFLGSFSYIIQQIKLAQVSSRDKMLLVGDNKWSYNTYFSSKMDRH